MRKILTNKWNNVVDLYFKDGKSIDHIASEYGTSKENIEEILSIYRLKVS